MTHTWKEGDVAVLWRPGASPVLVRIARGPQSVGSEGVIDLTAAIGKPSGAMVPWSGADCRLFRPTLGDLLGAVHRGAQIVTPKDAVRLLYLAGVGPGAQVAEAGSGSGALTIALAHAVGPTGHVTSFDRRADFLAAARGNVERVGYADRVTFLERDVARDGFDLTDLDGIILDLPEPWEVAPAARAALVPGGHLATYTPTYNQLERAVRSLRSAGFGEVRALEVIERGLHVGEGGTRPEFEMLGHTGFLAAGRRTE